MLRVYRDSLETEQKQETFEPRLNKKEESKKPITASTDPLDVFTADDIMSLITNVAELKDIFIQAVNCGDGLWEFMIGDNTYQISTCPV